MIGTVIVPLDGSELAEEALPYGQAIAERTKATLLLLEVVDLNAPAAAQDEARNYLSGLAGRFGGDAQVSVRLGSPADEIIDRADETPEAIVVMTTRGRSGIGRWLYGSVADRVVRGAVAPVLLVRSGMERAEIGAIRSIVAPLDGSAYAEAALGYAEELARAFGTELNLVQVIETARIYAALTPTTATGGAEFSATYIETIQEIIAQRASEADTYLSGVAERLGQAGVQVRTHTLEGTAAEQVLAFARETKTDLIVMATHGRSGLNRLVFGSVAERVLRTGETPVLMVHPKGEVEAKGEEKGEGTNAEA